MPRSRALVSAHALGVGRDAVERRRLNSMKAYPRASAVISSSWTAQAHGSDFATPGGFEPPTLSLEGTCSIQLS